MERRIKRSYFGSLSRKYARSSKKGKGEILDDLCPAEKCHRYVFSNYLCTYNGAGGECLLPLFIILRRWGSTVYDE